MRNTNKSCKINVACAKKALASYMKKFSHCTCKTQEAYLYDILNFFSYLEQNYENPPKHIYLNETRLTDWISNIAPNITIQRLSAILQRVGCFIEVLFVNGLISSNPIGLFKSRFGKNGWMGIARAFKSPTPKLSLESIRIQPRFTGYFGKQAKTYIELHRSIGEKYRIPELTLIGFNRFLRKKSISSAKAVTPKVVQEWVDNMECSQGCCRSKTFTLKKFFSYLNSMGYVECNPVTDSIIDYIGMPPRSFKAYIFSKEQVQKILENARNLPRCTLFPLRPQTIYTVVAILYTLGFRISEALNMKINDIDFQQNTIFIPQTKFYKQRLVPFGPKLGKCIGDYLKLRYKFYSHVKKKDPLFVGIKNTPITAVCVRDNFKQLKKSSGIPEASEKANPRLHDLRHSFAVHRLCRWYQEGVDVQKRLVLLSTFMGHFKISSTQVYLTITDNILKEANKRFYKNFGTVIEKDINYEN